MGSNPVPPEELFRKTGEFPEVPPPPWQVSQSELNMVL
jgi:hypothetical protein